MPPEEIQEEVVTTPPAGEPEPTTGEEGQVLEGQAPESTDAPAGDDAGAVHAKAEALAKRMAQKRIRQLTSKQRAAEEKLAKQQEQIDELLKQNNPEPARPSSADFETLEEYEDARDDWKDAVKSRKTESESPEQQAPTPEQVKRAENADRIEQDLDALGDQYPDAVEIVMNDEWSCSDSMYDFIEASEKGAALAYHLATNEDIASKIAGLSPVLAARELVRVEAGLPATTTKPSASPPPPPGTPVSPSAASVVTDPDKLTSAQWKEWRLGEMAKRA